MPGGQGSEQPCWPLHTQPQQSTGTEQVLSEGTGKKASSHIKEGKYGGKKKNYILSKEN